MNVNEVYCGVLTKDDTERIASLSKIKDIGFDLERLASFLAEPHNLAFTAEYNGEVAGFIYGYSLMSLDSEPQLFVYSVDVFDEFQNAGIGSKLFQFVVDYSRENGFSECFVITDRGNKRACRIYEKAGGKNDYEDEIVYVIKHEPAVAKL